MCSESRMKKQTDRHKRTKGKTQCPWTLRGVAGSIKINCDIRPFCFCTEAKEKVNIYIWIRSGFQNCEDLPAGRDQRSSHQLTAHCQGEIQLLPGASPWLHQCSGLYSGNERRILLVTESKFKHFPKQEWRFQYMEETISGVCVRARECGHVRQYVCLWSDTCPNSLFLSSTSHTSLSSLHQYWMVPPDFGSFWWGLALYPPEV